MLWSVPSTPLRASSRLRYSQPKSMRVCLPTGEALAAAATDLDVDVDSNHPENPSWCRSTRKTTTSKMVPSIPLPVPDFQLRRTLRQVSGDLAIRA